MPADPPITVRSQITLALADGELRLLAEAAEAERVRLEPWVLRILTRAAKRALRRRDQALVRAVREAVRP